MASVQQIKQPIEVPNFTSTGCVLFFTIAFALPHVFMSVISREVQMCVVQMSHWISQVLSNQQSDAIRLQSAIHHDPFGFGSNELSFPQGSQIICKAVVCCEPVQDSTRQTLHRTQMKWFPLGICINVGDYSLSKKVIFSYILVHPNPFVYLLFVDVSDPSDPMCRIDVHRCASMCIDVPCGGVTWQWSSKVQMPSRPPSTLLSPPLSLGWAWGVNGDDRLDRLDRLLVSSGPLAGPHKITLQESKCQMQINGTSREGSLTKTSVRWWIYSDMNYIELPWNHFSAWGSFPCYLLHFGARISLVWLLWLLVASWIS